MNKKKVISICDTRPEFIKVAAVSPHLNKFFDHIIVNTGQHYDFTMTKIFVKELSLPKSKYNLGVGSASPGVQIGRMLAKIDPILIREKPTVVIVYGDTNTTLAGALTAAKLNIPVAHVEAGMRSYDKKMPEEINRIIVDHVSSLFFCSSNYAIACLNKENIRSQIFLTGDINLDIFLKNKSDNTILKNLNFKPKDYYLATIHRQENTDNLSRLLQIMRIFEKLPKPVVFPVHPRTEKMIKKVSIRLKNILKIKPQGFGRFLALQAQAAAIITDSGGVQKEAYWLKTPCLTLRSSTEWPETLQNGWNHLVDINEKLILQYASNPKVPKNHPQLYGDGKASNKIAKILENYLR